MTGWIRSGNRLLMYGSRPDEAYWANTWVEETPGDLLERADSRPKFLEQFVKQLPRDGKILDGGCGLGQWVKLLLHFGYNIEGIDSSAGTIERALRFDPSLPVRVGNVLELDYPDEHFSAYLSLGVAEHFEDGPTDLLKEVHRVLRKDGVLMISVPYFNLWRRLTVRKNRREEDKSEAFYQYAFAEKEFRSILRQQGFTPLVSVPYSTWWPQGKASVITKARSLLTAGKSYRATNYLVGWLKKLTRTRLVMRFAGHMILFVARKS